MSDEKEKDAPAPDAEKSEESKPEEAPAKAEPTAAPKPEPEVEDIDERPLVLNRSVWFKPFTLIASSAITIAALVAIFFVPEDWAKVGLYVLGGIAVVSLCWLLYYLFMTKISATYTITPQRCTVERGLISRTINEVEIRHIRNINVRQSILQRLFAIGNVEISTAGGSDIEVVFESVHDPLGVRRRIADYNDADIYDDPEDD